MKRLPLYKLSLVVWLCASALFPFGTVLSQDEPLTLTPTSGLNVRIEPRVGAAKVTTIQPGSAYPVLSQTPHGYWYQIQLPDQAGWVCRAYTQLSNENLASTIPIDGSVADQDCQGRSVGTASPATVEQPPANEVVPDNMFIIYIDSGYPGNHFIPSGFMGDVGDITVDQDWTDNPHSGTTAIKISYVEAGLGPNECDYGPPCKWAGVYWQNPEGNWGTVPGAGFNLTGMTRVSFWARSDTIANIEFKVGGITGPYPDSLQPARSSGIVTLTSEWQWFSVDLTGADLSYVIGGLCWVTNWDSNSSGPVIFYLDDIVFEH